MSLVDTNTHNNAAPLALIHHAHTNESRFKTHNEARDVATQTSPKTPPRSHPNPSPQPSSLNNSNAGSTPYYPLRLSTPRRNNLQCRYGGHRGDDTFVVDDDLSLSLCHDNLHGYHSLFGSTAASLEPSVAWDRFPISSTPPGNTDPNAEFIISNILSPRRLCPELAQEAPQEHPDSDPSDDELFSAPPSNDSSYRNRRRRRYKNYGCPCEQNTPYRVNLNRHPFTCPKCNKYYTRSTAAVIRII